MLRKLYKEGNCLPVVLPGSDNFIVVTENVMQDGAMVRQSVVKCCNVAKDFDSYDYRDFNISNLLAIGAYKESPVVMSPNGQFGVVDSVSSLPVKPVES